MNRHQLTKKEWMLLEDQKKQEELCVHKYRTYAGQVKDQALRKMLDDFANQEQQHLDTINQMLSGQIPTVNAGQGSQSVYTWASVPAQSTALASQDDKMLLDDLLLTEKQVAAAYNTAIFEFTNSALRQALNHIQKEEQQHGEGIYNYLHAYGMYNPI